MRANIPVPGLLMQMRTLGEGERSMLKDLNALFLVLSG